MANSWLKSKAYAYQNKIFFHEKFTLAVSNFLRVHSEDFDSV